MQRRKPGKDYLNTLYEKYRDVLSESAENEVKLNAAKAKVEKSNAGMATSYDKLLAILGMTDEQCAAILAKERSDSVGIGVKNVNDRLKIYFGDKYGISIKSELDEGTEVTVRIPGNAEERQNEI